MEVLTQVVHLAIPFLPSRPKRWILRRILGWSIHPDARIGFSLVDAAQVELGPSARIGHFNVIRNLRALEISEGASIGNWNWCTAATDFTETRDARDSGRLVMGEHSAITSRHYVDCSGGVRIGQFSTIAGVRSTILSHQIDTVNSKQSALPVDIGSYCFVGSDVRIVPGSRIPDQCVIAMGTVVVGSLEESGTLYAGVPARKVKSVTGAYFDRSKGHVEH